ncbi:putative L-type lectin-domain containing receptor kinase VII.2, partial [Mucuna pruriens]
MIYNSLILTSQFICFTREEFDVFDPSNHVFGIEFDVFDNQEFNDINDNHVGVDINSLASFASHAAGFWGGKGGDKFEDLRLNDGENYQVWIDYLDSRVNVTMALAGQRRPEKPLISELVDLSEVLLDEMYVGFCGATGQLVKSHKILVFLCHWVLFLGRKMSKRKEGEEDIEDWELEYWPQHVRYEDIYAATKEFSDQNERVKVLKDVAHGVLYLNEGWEVKVLLRDIKASNVLLDKDINARLGDCGLATMHHHHEHVADTLRVIGTVGFMAPELIHTGRASTQTNVFSFGVLILEVVCERRPNEKNKPALVVEANGERRLT